MGAFKGICSQHGIDFFFRCFHAKGWKQSDAQRYVCDLIHTMDSTWRVQEVFPGMMVGDILGGMIWRAKMFVSAFLSLKNCNLGGGFKHVFFFQPYCRGDNPISLITNIFQMGWNHQLAMNFCPLAKHFVPPLHPEVSRCIGKKELWNWALFERQIPKLSLNISHDFGDECSCILK